MSNGSKPKTDKAEIIAGLKLFNHLKDSDSFPEIPNFPLEEDNVSPEFIAFQRATEEALELTDQELDSRRDAILANIASLFDKLPAHEREAYIEKVRIYSDSVAKVISQFSPPVDPLRFN